MITAAAGRPRGAAAAGRGGPGAGGLDCAESGSGVGNGAGALAAFRRLRDRELDITILGAVMDLTVNSQQRCFEGTQGFYSHESEVCDGTMNFALYQPPQTKGRNKVPVVNFLPGPHCTAEDFTLGSEESRVG